MDAYKIYSTESREDVKAATDKITDLIKDLPADSAGVAAVIRKVENLYISFRSPPAREYISGVIGQLADKKAFYAEEKRKAREPADAARAAAEAKADAAAKAAEEANDHYVAAHDC